MTSTSRWFPLRTLTPGSHPSTALFLIVGISIVLAGTSLLDIWIDIGLDAEPLWSTLLENTLPLIIAFGLPITAWRLYREYRPERFWHVAVWVSVGFGAALLLAGVVLGAQVVQEDLQPRIILLQVASGGAAAGLLIGQSVSEMRRTQEEVERDKLFESLKDSVLEGIVIADRDGTIVDWNRGAREIFGYKHEDVIGRPIETLFHTRHQKSFQEDVQRIHPSRNASRSNETIELNGVRQGGDEVPLELSLSSWETAGERYFAVIIRDITQRRELQRQILRVQEEERKNIGQDLHDGVASQLTGANLKLNLLSSQAEGDEMSEELKEVQALIEESAGDVRRLSRGLNPKGLQEGDLPSALQWLSENTDGAYFERSSDLPSLDTEMATHLYRIAQEATRNAQKYADAEEIRICLRRENGVLALDVEDDGQGFDPDTIGDEGFGLRSMHHRAELLGVELDIESSPGTGTLVRCRVPL